MIGKLLSYKVPVFSFLLTAAILIPVQLKVTPPVLLLERFFPGYGWFEILPVALYAFFVSSRMQNPAEVEKWRKISWLIFSSIFFGQLLLGICRESRFLMTGKLHLPVPAMIIAGPVYRGQLSFMPLLYISTVILTGPAWCSHLCYFGALDNWVASGRKLRNNPVKNIFRWKYSLFAVFIAMVILFRLLGINLLMATIFGTAFGLTGLFVILYYSRKSNKMIHCILVCPVGTLTGYLKYLSPFRMTIDSSCTTCMACSLKCRYDALTLKDIELLRPGLTCTYCGECLSACHQQAIRYRFMGLTSQAARNLYLVLTISIHASFIALGRI